MGRAWTHRGTGVFDGDVLSEELSAIAKDWDGSDATTPDLLPRLVFELGCASWDAVVLAVMRLLGPGVLAARPMLWRYRCMVPHFKAGSANVVDNWRQLEVQSQFGLLQQAVLYGRVEVRVRSFLTPGQSGYVRDVADAQLLLLELAAASEASSRPMWC